MRALRLPGPPRLLAALAFGAIAAVAGAAPAAADPFLIPCSREGSWAAPDRQVHFAASLAIAASLRVEGRSRLESVAGTAVIGVAKELYDATLKPRRLGRGASRKDLGADLLGALAGVLIVAAADR
ncbi:MAG TPA: hypothetical protein VE326_03780 [Candidatus Binatia bacterium]|nr:hypothetical protein [Candidatus Binatia bacterium]